MIWRKEQNIPVLKRLERTSKNTARLEQAETQQNRIAHTAPDCAGYVVHGGDKEPRLRFTEEERTDPALEKPIRRAQKAAVRADKAQARIPKKKVRQTVNGRLVTGFACDSRVADAEFLLAKREYISTTGRVRGEDDVLALLS